MDMNRWTPYGLDGLWPKHWHKLGEHVFFAVNELVTENFWVR